MAGFNVNKMFISSKKAIEAFAHQHQEETFYAFSVDANMLCLNSEERFKETLKSYQEEFPDVYNDSEEINDLKYNTGDWHYQGFFDLGDGFDYELYSEHYHIPFDNTSIKEDQLTKLFQNTPYHKAMSELLDKLRESKVFNKLKVSSNFRIFLSEHSY